MIRKILTLTLFVGLHVSLCAQSTGGFKGGLNLAKEKASASGASVTTDNLLAPHLGMYFINTFSEQFGLQYELVYSIEGGKVQGIEDRISYLNFPVLLRLQAGSVVNIHLGPQLGFMLAAKTNDVDISDGVKQTNISGVIGIGIETNAGFLIGARYVVGLTDISKENIGAEYKLNTIQLWTGIRLFGNK